MSRMPNSLHPSLSTTDDLEADQAEFFRQNLSPDALPASTEDAIAALSLARDKPSASAALLDPIQERHVTRRRRKTRPKISTTSFPQVQAVHGRSKFGRGARGETEYDSTAGNGDKRERRGQSDEQIFGMSPEQLAEARAEIEGLLSADSIQFLKERGRVKADGSKATEKEKDHEKIFHSNTQEGNDKGLEKFKTEAETELDVENGAGEEREAEKRMWMSNANENVGDQEEVDSLVATAVKELGVLGGRRFDLEGEVLSPEESDTLPMHLGLHHHGSAPTKAGYSLADLLLLTRSSVITQRVLALKILTVLVRRYRNEVLGPLIKSGGLALVFAEFPAYASFESARTVQMTYVDAVEAIIRDSLQVPGEQLVPGLYFASKFYSGSLMEQPNACVDILARSGCLGLLANIARANARRRDSEGFTLRSLSMIRAIVRGSFVAAETIVKADSVPGKILQQLACNTDSANPCTIMLSCDALAHAVVNTERENDEALRILDATILNDEFLRKVSLHLAWFSEEQFSSQSARRRKAALGALRMLRAAIAFERGVMVFTSVAEHVCQLAQDIETSAESFLALEAYAYILYTLGSTKADLEKAETKSKHAKLEHGFVADQLSELIPIALSSARLFTSMRSPMDSNGISRKAAAGHFTATVLGVTTIPMSKTVVAELFGNCSATSVEMVSLVEESRAVDHQYKRHDTLLYIQALASVSHAGVRMLSKVCLDPLYAKREVVSLINCAEFEARVMEGSGSCNPYRPIANACVEWVASLTKVNCSRETVSYGVQLLPMLFDTQVVLDLLSRCILKATALSGLSDRITLEEARKCAQELLPIVLNELRTISHEDQKGSRLTIGDNEIPSKTLGVTSLRGLLSLWINHIETPDCCIWVSKAFYDARFLLANELFQTLLRSPFSFFLNEEYVSLMYAFAHDAYVGGQELLQGEETVLSSVSTSKSSEFVEALLAMTERLSSRGPQAADRPNATDHLASVVLSVMCDTQADVSLRLSMWRKTIIECGGGMLFQNSHFIPTSEGVPNNTAVREEDGMLSAFSNAIVEGSLQGERCPSVLASVLALRFNDALRNGEQEHVLDPIKASLLDASQTAVLNTIRVILKSERDGARMSLLFKWVQQQITHQNRT